jgi:hypothetical protein
MRFRIRTEKQACFLKRAPLFEEYFGFFESFVVILQIHIQGTGLLVDNRQLIPGTWVSRGIFPWISPDLAVYTSELAPPYLKHFHGTHARHSR